MRSCLLKYLERIRIDDVFLFFFNPLAFVYAFPLRLCLTMQRIQCETLQRLIGRRVCGLGVTMCFRPSSALPFLKNSLVWAQAFLLLRQHVERGGGVKVMSGGRQLALIINHFVQLLSTSCLFLAS